MADFNQDNPPIHVTNPFAVRKDEKGAYISVPVDRDYPAHLHRSAIMPDDAPPFIEVRNDEEKLRGLREGWLEFPPGASAPAGVHPSRVMVTDLLDEIAQLKAQLENGLRDKLIAANEENERLKAQLQAQAQAGNSMPLMSEETRQKLVGTAKK